MMVVKFIINPTSLLSDSCVSQCGGDQLGGGTAPRDQVVGHVQKLGQVDLSPLPQGLF